VGQAESRRPLTRLPSCTVQRSSSVAVARCTRLLLDVFALLIVTTPPRLQPFRPAVDDVHTAEPLLYGTACGGYRGCTIRGCDIPSRCERMLRLYVSAPCREAPSSSAVKLNKPLADASRLGANTYCRVACRSQMQTQSDASLFPTPARPFRVCVSNPKTAEGPFLIPLLGVCLSTRRPRWYGMLTGQVVVSSRNSCALSLHSLLRAG
jgi:hypothetical protein